MIKALAPLHRAKLSLLLDLRLAPARNDPTYEAAVSPLRKGVTQDFFRVGALLQSAVGKLQIQRYAREDGIALQAFVNESLALAYLSR
jgi:hypothetical protein